MRIKARLFKIGCGELICIDEVGLHYYCGDDSCETVYFCRKCKNKLELIVGFLAGICIGALTGVLIALLT